MYKIGFHFEDKTGNEKSKAGTEIHTILPRPSMVDVSFVNDGRTYTYLNEHFDLSLGDLVFVDGIMAGKPGIVKHIQYGFKVRRSEYKTVISRAETDVHGKFYAGGCNYLTFERDVLPDNKVRTWFLPPLKEGDEYAVGFDDDEFPLDTLEGFEFSDKIADRGRDYYLNSHVVYLSLDDGRGYAIVFGTQAYEVEFTCHSGNLSSVVCSCNCSYNCKHEYAVILQLRELLDTIDKKYSSLYNETHYFAAVNTEVLMHYAKSAGDESSLIL